MQKYSVNKAIIVGNIGQDVELKYTTNQIPVANFSVATTESRKDNSGGYVDFTEWHRIVAFRHTAEFVSKHLGKGSTIYVEGRLQTRSWDDKNGIKKYSTEIVADVVTPVGGKSRTIDMEQKNSGFGPDPAFGEKKGGSFPSQDTFGDNDEEPLPF